MKLWFKVLWVILGIVPCAIGGLAIYRGSDFEQVYFLIMLASWWLMIWSAANLVIQFIMITKKYCLKKALRWAVWVVAIYGALFLSVWLYLSFTRQ